MNTESANLQLPRQETRRKKYVQLRGLNSIPTCSLSRLSVQYLNVGKDNVHNMNYILRSMLD